MDERLERQARNEGLLRTVNQTRASLDEHTSGWAEPDHLFEFVCECGAGCEARVEMTLSEYERVREQSDRFAVLPGHENEAIETVVEQDNRFLIVDKRPGFERFADSPNATGAAETG